MASKRQEAKNAVVAKENEDPELDDALSNAALIQLETAKENNRHKEAMQGHLGRFFGTVQNAVTLAAMFAVICGFGFFFACMIFAYNSTPDFADFWQKNGERSLAAGAAALTFLFGKGLR